jgi:hypothetical protein
MTLEELHSTLVLLRGCTGFERAQIFPLSGFWIILAGV